MHHVGAHLVARALRGSKYGRENAIFCQFSQYQLTGARFFRAQPRARPNGARQWILLTNEILFDYLIASVA